MNHSLQTLAQTSWSQYLTAQQTSGLNQPTSHLLDGPCHSLQPRLKTSLRMRSCRHHACPAPPRLALPPPGSPPTLPRPPARKSAAWHGSAARPHQPSQTMSSLPAGSLMNGTRPCLDWKHCQTGTPSKASMLMAKGRAMLCTALQMGTCTRATLLRTACKALVSTPLHIKADLLARYMLKALT